MFDSKRYHPPKNQRLDSNLYQQTNQVTFITIRAYQHASPFGEAQLCQVVIDTLLEEQERQVCGILAYCLMPDHLHYLIRPTQEGRSVLTFTDQYKGKTTHRAWKMGWQGKLWEPRYYDHLVRSDESLDALIAYILNNPVRRGWVEDSHNWPWSNFYPDIL